MKAVAEANPRLTIQRLPAYAPDLNPVEQLWCLTKYHRMANHTIGSVEGLLAEAQRHVGAVAADDRLLRSCFAMAKLPIAPS